MSKIKTFSGFTLIELMVAISIVAILTTIGLAAYSTIQGNARDAKKKGDIDAIANALEINKTSSAYQAIAADQFSGGTMPIETNGYKYCIQTGITTAPAVLTTKDECEGGWTAILDTLTASQDSSEWVLCTELENSTTPYCKSSAQ